MSYQAAKTPLYGSQSIDRVSQYDALCVDEYLAVHRSSCLHQPELGLMAAVLEDAINCYLTCLLADTRRGKRIFAEAEEWFFSEPDNWLFSFDSVCGFLGIDPGFVRRGLLQCKRRATKVKRPVHTEPHHAMRRVA